MHAQIPKTPWTPHRYPITRRSEHVDVYKSAINGEVSVRDPYGWLEHSTSETEEWANGQVAFTRAYLDQNPDRQRLEENIRKNSDYAKVCSRQFRTTLFSLWRDLRYSS